MKVDVKEVAVIIQREFGIDQPVDIIESMIMNSINTNKKAGKKPEKQECYYYPTGHDLYEMMEDDALAAYNEWCDSHG